MITTNINGNAISQGFIDEIQSDSPNVIARLWYNNAELECDIVEITVEKGSCGSNPFMIGEVVGDLLTATVKDLITDIKGKVIECHIGALVSGNYEYVSLGKFTVAEVKKTRYQSEITAYSGIVANSTGDFDTSGLTSPTILNLATRLQSDLNCTITFGTGIDTSLTVTAQLNGLTDYQALQVLAVCCGGYIINTNDGNIVVKKYDATPTLNVDTGMMVNLPQIAEMPYKVRNVGVLVSEATEDNEGNEIEEVYYTLASQEYIKVIKQGTEYYLEDENGNRIIANARPELADLYFECIYITENIFNGNIKQIVGYEYYPATIDITLGDPRLEGSDVLNVKEIDGTYYAVPCHKITHKYTGGFTTEVRSADASDESNDIGTVAPITQKLQSIDRKTGKAQATANNAYQIAGNTNQYFWFTGTGTDTGAHITEVPQDDWNDSNSPYYHSGGNLLARSNGIAVRDGMTELATFGASGAQIGKTGEAHLEMDYASMQFVDSDGNPFFRIFDLNDEHGHYEKVETHTGYDLTVVISGATYYAVGLSEYADSVVSVTVNGVSKVSPTDYILYTDQLYGTSLICFTTNIGTTATVVVDYYVDSDALKAYTIGTRASGSDVGMFSIAEGYEVEASGKHSHAEGSETVASGFFSHASGLGTIAQGNSQTVVGKYNVADTSSLFIIGKGTADNARANALTVKQNGNVYPSGRVIETASALTKTYNNNSYVTQTQFNRIYARKVGNLIIVQGNLQIDSGIPSNTTVKIGTINGMGTIIQDALQQVPVQTGGSINVSITTDGDVTLYSYNATSGTGWARFNCTLVASD